MRVSRMQSEQSAEHDAAPGAFTTRPSQQDDNNNPDAAIQVLSLALARALAIPVVPRQNSGGRKQQQSNGGGWNFFACHFHLSTTNTTTSTSPQPPAVHVHEKDHIANDHHVQRNHYGHHGHGPTGYHANAHAQARQAVDIHEDNGVGIPVRRPRVVDEDSIHVHDVHPAPRIIDGTDDNDTRQVVNGVDVVAAHGGGVQLELDVSTAWPRLMI